MGTAAKKKKGDDVIIIKKYANRRLYNTGTSTYVTLDDLYDMVKEGSNFEVRDAKTNEDLTRSVLTQIIFERESKSAQNLLPINFLKQLILFYDDSIQSFVPHYLESMMGAFTNNQEQMRDYFEKHGFSTDLPKQMSEFNPFSQMEELTKQNMELFQQGMNMFFGGMGGKK